MFGKILGTAAAFAGPIVDAFGIKTQKDIADDNLGLQQENLAYQKWAQQETWNREDAATQRKVADLKAAGLSPVLAAGSASPTSVPIRTEAPQKDSSWADGLGSKVSNNLSTAMNLASTMAGIEQQMANISKTKAEEDYIYLQKKRGEVGLQLETQILPYSLRLKLAEALDKESQIDLRKVDQAIREYDLVLSRDRNIRYRDTMPSVLNLLNSGPSSISPILQMGGEKIADLVESLPGKGSSSDKRRLGAEFIRRLLYF